MQVTDILFFIGLILLLAGAVYLLHRIDVKEKNKHKIHAYNLLDKDNPDPKDIKNSIRLLSAYGGRFRKDQEFMELKKLLSGLLYEIEKTEAEQSKKVRK
ncbi:MAG: hypothetical protein A2Y89_02015 [Chloroflexi bacterium RBG_13_51_18]|nr:MAG: hypothetical protein A2Y89_02015 [Chloroflexi bacterium RBG_13_51_18]